MSTYPLRLSTSNARTTRGEDARTEANVELMLLVAMSMSRTLLLKQLLTHQESAPASRMAGKGIAFEDRSVHSSQLAKSLIFSLMNEAILATPASRNMHGDSKSYVVWQGRNLRSLLHWQHFW